MSKSINNTDNNNSTANNKKFNSGESTAEAAAGVEHMDDKLDILFNKQNELYKKQLENSENKMKNLYDIKEPFEGYRIFMLSTALVHEAIELQRETNWKWWKKENAMNRDKIQEEIIDVWHFLIQLSIEAELDSKKLVEKYLQKNEENLKRQVKGY
jgi:dimeric dUTPase (all-alpha-NTP-PPase superfamily)